MQVKNNNLSIFNFNTMSHFFKKLGLFLMPCILVLLGIVYLDFFKVFFEYDEYYTEDLFVSLNREYVCLKSLEKKSEISKPNSFIFGSSRSQAFKCRDWNKYLSDSAISFHFDAANEAIVGVVEKLQYLKKNKYEITNVLLIVDEGLLTQTDFNQRNSSLTISHPEISSNNSFDFYLPFITASINPKFVASYMDYSMFKTHRKYMGQYIANTRYPNLVNPVNMDIFYGKEKEIQEDSISYYNRLNLSGVFYEREIITRDFSDINNYTKDQLSIIKELFQEFNCSYKVIVSPMYDQIELDSIYKQMLIDVFQKENVFDYSGKNEWTEPIGNFYETSHYRPFVARRIMSQVYK